MTPIFRTPTDLTPAVLTAILRQRGTLPAGEVSRVAVECHTPFLSEVCNLTLTYSSDAPPSVPRSLFMKLQPGDGPIDQRGKREILFYQSLLDSDTALPVPTCYHAAYDEDSGATSLLLADLSASHDTLQHELPPTEKQCYQLMEVLARIHAHWWERPHMAELAGPAPTVQTLTDDFANVVEMYRAFADFLGDRLLPSRRTIYERVITDFLPLKLARFAGHTNLTLTHGDAHAWNFMYPTNEADLPVLLDWEVLGTNLPTFDPAYLMTVFWHPRRREWLEQPLVRHYHARLVESGVMGYAWADCWRDYRLSVAEMIFEPVWWWKMNMPAFLWWHRLERIMLAFEDLNCLDLLS